MEDSGRIGRKEPAKTPAIYTVTCTLADTEYSEQLPTGTRYFTMQARQNNSVRFAFVAGRVAGPVEPYGTMKMGVPHDSPEIKLITSLTIYLASSVAGTIVEIVAWS